jgi:hypothetical protein
VKVLGSEGKAIKASVYGMHAVTIVRRAGWPIWHGQKESVSLPPTPPWTVHFAKQVGICLRVLPLSLPGETEKMTLSSSSIGTLTSHQDNIPNLHVITLHVTSIISSGKGLEELQGT